MSNLFANLQKLAAAPELMSGSLLQAAEVVKEQAQDLAPVQTGELRDSAYVTAGEAGEVIVGFSASHAVKIHERTDLSHPTGQAKFLEHGSAVSVEKVGGILAAGAREAIQKTIS